MSANIETLPVPAYGVPEIIERDGHRYRLECQPDENSSVTTDDFYGAFAWDRHERPVGFDGGAHKIPPDQMIDIGLWWQPPTDVPVDRVPEMKAHVIDLLRWGFNGYIVSRLETCDMGHDHVADSASLWGIESTLIDGVEDYVRDTVLPELLAEVDLVAEDHGEASPAQMRERELSLEYLRQMARVRDSER